MADRRGTDAAGLDLTGSELDGEVLTHAELTDAELTALALAGDPDAPLDRDSVPMTDYLDQPPAALPEWYMPPVRARSGKRWRSTVVLVIVAAFLVIEAVGLCSTYGWVGFG